MDNTIPHTVCCILCRGAVIYRNGDKMRFREHMRMEHGAFFDLDFLLASCLMDVQKKDELSRTVTACELGEETLLENTLDKDDQTFPALLPSEAKTETSEVKTEPSLKKKRGRKKKVKVPESSDQAPLIEANGVETGDEQFYSDVENSDNMDMSSSSLGGEGQNLENLLSEAVEGVKERFECQVDGCGKSYNTKGNRMTHEKKAHGILGPRAAKKQRLSLVQDDTPTIDTNPVPDHQESNQENQPSQDYFEAPASNSFLTDTSLGLEDTEGGDDALPEEVKKAVGEVDVSSSQYFKNNPKILSTARDSSVSLFDQVNPSLPLGWRQRILTVISKSGDKVTNRHYLSPEMKVLKSGMAVVEYLRLKGEFDIDQLKLLAKDLNIADKKFQSLFSV